MTWTATKYGYEKYSITDERGTEIGFAHRPKDAGLMASAQELYDALSDLIPPMPPEDALCHKGICSQERCCNCGRIAAGHRALEKARCLEA